VAAVVAMEIADLAPPRALRVVKPLHSPQRISRKRLPLPN